MQVAAAHVDIKVEGACSATCHTYPHRGPILTVDTPAAHLRLSGWGDRVDPDGVEVEFAEALLAAVAAYRDELRARTATAGVAAVAVAEAAAVPASAGDR